jgi:hypothetical protein
MRGVERREKIMKTAGFRTLVCSAMPILAAIAWFPTRLVSQTGQSATTPAVRPENDSAQMVGMADHAMSDPMDVDVMKHMELTPLRAAPASNG